jgi:cytoskeletal protein RodZ
LDPITLPFVSVIIYNLGIPGLLFVVWWYDHKSQVKQRELDKEEHDKERAVHAKEISTILGQYKDDVSSIRQLYQNNVELVHNYDKSQLRIEKLYQETISVVSLNTQTQTELVVSIKSNHFCPTVRAAGPQQ